MRSTYLYVGGASWIFQVLPLGYLHKLTVCNWIVIQDLPLFSLHTSVKWAHYIHDVMITCEGSLLLQGTLQTLLGHLQGNEPPENSRFRYCHKVWGAVSSGKKHVVPEAVID